MTPEKTLISLIKIFDTYKNTDLGLHIPSDDCECLSNDLKKLVEKYHINDEEISKENI